MTDIYKSPGGQRLILDTYRELLTRWPIPCEQLALATREGETGVIRCGNPDAPPLLLFHGSMSNSLMWMGAAASFAPHFHLHAVDIIGEAGMSAPARPDLASDAYALWLDDVIAGLGIHSPGMVGISLGGWLALDYAIRRPGQVARLAVMCPAGVGRQRRSFYLKALLYLMLGSRGREKLRNEVLGRPGGAASEPLEEPLLAYMNYLSLIQAHFRPRVVRFQPFSDAMLESLTMPLLTIVGGRDVFFDSGETRARVERCAPHARVLYHEELGHMLTGQEEAILEFLVGAPS